MDRQAHDYDVIVVGGRPAGASLAARLGARGRRVLVLDKAVFPSRPAVSAPFLLPHALELLDELGLDEAVYAAQTPPLRRIMLEFGDYFRARFRFYEPVAGHFYGIDRARLDDALWHNLERHDSVTTHSGAAVLDVLRDADGRVHGVVARLGEGEAPQHFHARCVIGADGRHSTVARKVGAQVTDERRDVDTTIYYAHWEGVDAYDDGERDVAQIHTSCDGFSFVLMPTADEQVIVVAQGQAALYGQQQGSSQEVYESLLRARPHVWWRLRNARQATGLSGYKRIGNLFRQPHGPGWALVGDAYHQKDSLDAQGIYDALLGAKLLAQELDGWLADERSWDEAMDGYGRRVRDAVLPMFEATMERVKREIYSIPPPLASKTLLRWILTHESYGRRYTAVVTRRLEPGQLFEPPGMLKSALGGAWERAMTVLRRRPDPTDPLQPPARAP